MWSKWYTLIQLLSQITHKRWTHMNHFSSKQENKQKCHSLDIVFHCTCSALIAGTSHQIHRLFRCTAPSAIRFRFISVDTCLPVRIWVHAARRGGCDPLGWSFLDQATAVRSGKGLGTVVDTAAVRSAVLGGTNTVRGAVDGKWQRMTGRSEVIVNCIQMKVYRRFCCIYNNIIEQGLFAHTHPQHNNKTTIVRCWRDDEFVNGFDQLQLMLNPTKQQTADNSNPLFTGPLRERCTQ